MSPKKKCPEQCEPVSIVRCDIKPARLRIAGDGSTISIWRRLHAETPIPE
jgi:hypothetical protein